MGEGVRAGVSVEGLAHGRGCESRGAGLDGHEARKA